MRLAAERALGGSPGFVSVKATAENTTLADKSVDVVTAAQSFHWFDADAFKRECKRILKPGGKAVLGLEFKRRKKSARNGERGDMQTFLQRF